MVSASTPLPEVSPVFLHAALSFNPRQDFTGYAGGYQLERKTDKLG
ncbi:hypothetical protein [uncultured Varibaculum sp.]|nr:hypothetical protein [uncultured Varibaculum sp.]